MGVARLEAMHLADVGAPPVLDAVALNKLQMLGAEVVGEIVQLFMLDVPDRLVKLRHAVAAQSSDTIMREAHALRGSALAVGAARLARLCAAIESDARAGLLDKAIDRSTELESAFEEVHEALRQVHG